MKSRLTTKIVSIAAILGLFAMAGYAFAYDGWGRGHHRSGYAMNGSENCPAWGDNAGQRRWSNLSPEDAKALDEERQAFFQATRDLRASLYQKGLALRSELAKAEPDAGQASEIQAEISKLRGELDQKRLVHRIEMQKRFPDAGPLMGYGQGRGRGGMQGRGGMGGGGYGQGACWR